jgi:hypothetical protein
MTRQAACTVWRHTRSAERATELANLLEFATNFVRLLGSHLSVQWSGQHGLSHTDCVSIVALDASPVARRRVPFRDGLVDVIMGEAIHEAGHCAYTTPAATQELQAAGTTASLAPADLQLLHKLFNILEDGYIEARLKQDWPNLAPYIDAINVHLFPATLQRRLQAAIVSRFDATAFLNALLGFAVLDWPVLRSPPSIAPMLHTLHQTAHAIRTEHIVAERVQAAFRLLTVFKQLFPQAEPPQSGAADRKPCTAFRPGRRLSSRLAAAVNAAVAAGAAGGAFIPPGNSGQTQGSAAQGMSRQAGRRNDTADARLHAEAKPVAERVRRALHLRASRAGTKVRGLSSGQLSLRRLHRVAFGESTVFERRRLDRLDVAIGVLLDCSGSTKPIWRTCQLCAVAIADGLQHARDVTVVIAAYQGLDRGCLVTPLYDARTRSVRLDGVSPHGSTPSAAALRHMALLLQQTRARDRILLHFTDGQPDDAAAVRTAVTDLARTGTAIWTLAAGAVDTTTLQACYGRAFRRLSRATELPEAIAEMVAAVVNTGARR